MAALTNGRSETPQVVERRRQLAEAALLTLAELGYARTSLREIAQNSPFSHGVVHYYFADKKELMAHCVDLYVERASTRYASIIGTEGIAEYEEAVVQTMRTSVLEDLAFHRIYFDLSVQSMFDADLIEHANTIRETLRDRIDLVIRRYAEIKNTTPALSIGTVYSMFDGTLLQSVRSAVAGDHDAAMDHIEEGCRLLMMATVPG